MVLWWYKKELEGQHGRLDNTPRLVLAVHLTNQQSKTKQMGTIFGKQSVAEPRF